MVHGFGWRDYKKPMSKAGDRNVGSSADLTSRLKSILGDIVSGFRVVPERPNSITTETVLSKITGLGYKVC